MKSLIKKGAVYLFIASVAINSSAVEREPQQIKDLRYGEALFNFYQENYFTSITNLMVAKHRNPITSQNVDPELLLGGLYLYYGLHQNASDIFTGMVENNTSEETQDRAWFNIGKMQYRGELYQQANQTLAKVKDNLSSEREAERQNMLANTFLKQKDFKAAFESIKALDSNQDWQTYAKYNLGISLIKSGQNVEGTKLLNEIGSLQTEDTELKALRDKTNVALGYAYIRQNAPETAVHFLQKVRLKGPLSAKALLGVGWAYQQQNKLEQALVSWMELKDWPVIDTAVQESLLAIPYTLEKMNKNQLALQHYNDAINNYNNELNSLVSVMKAVKAGELMFALRPAMVTESTLEPEYRNKLPDSISVPYLQHLVNSVDFQRVHKNYLDLIYLRKNLLNWRNQFSAYYLMLKERARYYNKQLKTTRNDSRLKSYQKLKTKRDILAKKVKQIETYQRLSDLASEEEKETLDSLEKVNKTLTRLSKKDDYSEEKEKYKLFHGLMLWDISTDYTPRYWKVKNELNQVDKALSETRLRLQSLNISTKNAPNSYKGYYNRIKDKQKRLDILLRKTFAIISEQEKQIEEQALISLQQRYRQIKNYHTRASYSLARLHDRLTLPENIKSFEQPEKEMEGKK